MADDKVFLGIDVGTGSARAGLFSEGGALLGVASVALETNHPAPDFVEQSSGQIWEACCGATRAALAKSGIDPALVAGVGFDATCSLVVLDRNDAALTVSPSGDNRWNVVVWMDHRATGEAARIDATGHPILQRTGGKISPEMELPKLAWLKAHMPATWAAAGAFYDLPDWLVHRATGSVARSLCSTVAKWTYLGELGTAGEGWDQEFLALIGLGDLADNGFARIGQRFLAPGEMAGSLSAEAAQELGLPAGIPVASGAIDAYAGALGTLGIGEQVDADSLSRRMALIGGTSTCDLVATPQALFVPGVWGPYYGVLLPGMWANEAGQSASGALIDRVLRGDAAWPALELAAKDKNCSVYDVLNARLAELAGEKPLAELTKNLHVQADFHGNRSPLADPHRAGMISGLTLETGLDNLALVYLATIQSLAYGTRHILETFAGQGARFDTMVMSGGLARNALYRQEHADVTGCTVITATHSEAVLLGSAIMGAVAAGFSPDLPSAMAAMSGGHESVSPDATRRAYHDRKYRVFRRMQEDFSAYREVMAG